MPHTHTWQEAEKALHYLETIGPAPLVGQLLIALACTAGFLLSEAQSVSEVIAKKMCTPRTIMNTLIIGYEKLKSICWKVQYKHVYLMCPGLLTTAPYIK